MPSRRASKAKTSPRWCHSETQTRRGIWNIENLDFGQLLKDNVTEFLFVWVLLRIVGGTGSPGNPEAIY